ncbi:uncharacterized protein A1O9_11784 [Exophiala aquamarina CBS 119918]|uniref:Protein BFR2 n=1 Tax=Exophiala aquamarina CBS 119918 TaxID=1182545 RepID=A0A072NYR0_9EURO|nr:uncharacterized protein A1O9_11784 [Exophiala aquamarina CBS 119918]KEF52158.1 hypothetical protein A1O9_11784 [Exophiala aquamarina CBS 119918]
MRGLRDQAKRLEYKKSKDYDPEDDAATHSDDDEEYSDGEGEANSGAGREHYESVGQSKLRKSDEPALGAIYEGVAVSRKALEEQDDRDAEEDPFAPVDDDEDDDDPFGVKDEDISDSDDASGLNGPIDGGAEIDEDDEIDSDEALGESDVERFKNFTFRGSKINSRGSVEEDESGSQESEEEDDLSDDQSSEQSEGLDSDVDMDDDDELSESEPESPASSSASSPLPSKPKSSRDLARAELRKAATSTSSTAALASALSASASADVKKGQAVKQQQKTFDRLLDARIKLQKGLTVASELDNTTLVAEQDVQAAAQQAEEAALALWSTIDSIRCAFMGAHNASSHRTKSDGQEELKRKRPLAPTRDTSTSELWNHTTALDLSTNAVHRATLDKWNAKTQPIIDASAARSKLLPGSSSHTHSSRLTSVLDTYLASSSATLIQSSTPSDHNALYDDMPFYQSLLRDLITSRNAATGTDNSDTIYLPPKLHTSGSRAKKVDTKASKGRKVRYNVHEKLQDFMAVEDRGTWEDAARTEFFASLFGNRGALDEVDDDDEEDGGDGDGDAGKEEVALRLFRN